MSQTLYSLFLLSTKEYLEIFTCCILLCVIHCCVDSHKYTVSKDLELIISSTLIVKMHDLFCIQQAFFLLWIYRMQNKSEICNLFSGTLFLSILNQDTSSFGPIEKVSSTIIFICWK
jgi:hypothetical protein